MLIAPDGSPFVSLGVTHLGAIPEEGDGFAQLGGSRRLFAERVIADLRELGFNTAGYHHTAEFRELMPFIADTFLAWIPYFDPHPRYFDVFSQGFIAGMRRQIGQMCSAAKANPNLIGYYWTDTPRWDLDNARRMVGDDWVSAIRGLPAAYAGKQHYVSFLCKRYRGQRRDFQSAYGVELEEAALLVSDFSQLALADPRVHRDDYEFLRLIARQYYKVAGEMMEREDRRHLVFGDRYLLADLPTEVLEEALQWIDVVAVQPCHARFERDAFDRVYRIARKPILICDHAISFPDALNRQTAWEQRGTEAEAALAYRDYLAEAFARPYVVGYHRCHYFDRFAATHGLLMQGLRAENGTPHQVLTDVVRRANVQVRRELMASSAQASPAD